MGSFRENVGAITEQQRAYLGFNTKGPQTSIVGK